MNATPIRLADQPGPLGNRVYLYCDGPEPRVLKQYRPRAALWVEWVGEAGARALNGKQGFACEWRYYTERRLLELWRGHGLDVPRVYDAALPDGVAPPALWLEYCPGPLLGDVLADAATPTARQRELIAWLGRETDRRHALAEHLGEPGLLHEHGSVKHQLLCGGRLVTFDLEAAYTRRRAIPTAIGEELSNLLHSLLRYTWLPADEALAHFAAGYGSLERLRRVGAELEARTPRALAKRVADRRRRGDTSKLSALRRLVRLVS